MGRKLKGARRQTWGIEIYVKVNGKQFQKTLPPDTKDRDVAVERDKFRLEKLDELKAAGKITTRGTLAADVEKFLATMPAKSRRRADFAITLKRWTDRFPETTRVELSESDVKAAFFEWQTKLAGSTLNHIRQALISLYKHYDGIDHACPAKKITKFKEPRGRQGFFEHHEFLEVCKHLEKWPDYRDLAEFLYYSGWRHSEGRNLQWSEIDQAGGVIRLSPERSKNDEGRVLPIEGAIKTVIDRRIAARCDDLPVFHYERGDKRRPINNWRKTWKKACRAANLTGKRLHDCRRTVVRNLTRAGVPERVAMSWTGHKTRSVFDRYNIVNENDLRDAGQKMQDHLRKAVTHGSTEVPGQA